jgi:multiple sugar transport system permease protein/raffinose/stachyose/melibiose transport system permease protein
VDQRNVAPAAHSPRVTVAARGAPMISRAFLLVVVVAYTAFAAGPFLWVATMSLRTTSEIALDHYAWPGTLHWEKFPQAWFNSNYSVYFENSLVVVAASVAVLTVVGAMAAHCFARYRFRTNRLLYFVIFSAIIFPPQITIIALFQILVQYGLYNSLVGLSLVYIAVQLPLTVYILESFFARIPADLFDAARIDGYSEWQIFWKVSLPIAMPAIATGGRPLRFCAWICWISFSCACCFDIASIWRRC